MMYELQTQKVGAKITKYFIASRRETAACLTHYN